MIWIQCHNNHIYALDKCKGRGTVGRSHFIVCHHIQSACVSRSLDLVAGACFGP